MKISVAILDKPLARGMGASLVMAGVTAGLAQVALRLPFTPVPVTLQTLAVVLSGMLLGSRLGALAQLEYLALGVAGAPIFAGWSGGPAALAGPSGGYLPGFVLGAFVTGLIFERWGDRSIIRAFVAGMVGVAAVYACGASWLAVWMRLAGSPAPGTSAWLLGVAPFVGVDALKVTAAAMIATGRLRWRP